MFFFSWLGALFSLITLMLFLPCFFREHSVMDEEMAYLRKL